jgi:hypothetical protein
MAAYSDAARSLSTASSATNALNAASWFTRFDLL